MRYGADKVFRSENVEITDEELDAMIANAKNLTDERAKQMANIEDKAKRDLLDFSDATVNFQEFEGVDYKAMAGQGDMEFMQLMQDSMGKRERTGTSYNERDFYRGSTSAPAQTDKSMPKARPPFSPIPEPGSQVLSEMDGHVHTDCAHNPRQGPGLDPPPHPRPYPRLLPGAQDPRHEGLPALQRASHHRAVRA